MVGGFFQVAHGSTPVAAQAASRSRSAQVLIQLVAVGDKAVEVIVVCLPLVDQQLGQGTGQVGLSCRHGIAGSFLLA